MGFSDSVAREVLVKSARSCCVCHRHCGTKIELHHIEPTSQGGSDDIDNCIPLCFDCHADVKHYNPDHPKGRKFKPAELKAHRDAWFAQIASAGVESCSSEVIPLPTDPANVSKLNVEDRFTKAVEQLGNENQLLIRLGGIYALEKIAEDSRERYHWTVMEVLCSFVRTFAAAREIPETEMNGSAANDREEQSIQEKPRVAEDIQTIMTVIGRRKDGDEEQQQRVEELEKGKWLNLACVDLRGANLRKSNLSGVNLSRADLSRVNLSRADLRKAILYRVDLKKANLHGADLSQASLHRASLAEADLRGAVFREARLLGSDFTDANLPPGPDNLKISLGLRDLNPPNFTEANLDSAILVGANLRTARGLRQIQLDAAEGSEYTRVPEEERPPKWEPEVNRDEYHRWLKERLKK